MHPIIQTLLIISLSALIQVLVPWIILSNLKAKAPSTDISGIPKERQEYLKKKYGGIPFYAVIVFFLLTGVFIITFIHPIGYLVESFIAYRFPNQLILLSASKYIHFFYLLFWGMLFAVISIELIFILTLFPLFPNNKDLRYIFYMIETSNGAASPLETKDTIFKFSIVLTPLTIGLILLSSNYYLSLEQTKVQCSNFWSLSNTEINYEDIKRIEYTKEKTLNSNHLYPRHFMIYSKNGENCNTQSLDDSDPDSTVDFLVSKTGLEPEIKIVIDND